MFTQSLLKVKVSRDHPLKKPIAIVIAEDQDDGICVVGKSCPCAERDFALLEGDLDLFKIDLESGTEMFKYFVYANQISNEFVLIDNF